jgi:hypothetical protein
LLSGEGDQLFKDRKQIGCKVWVGFVRGFVEKGAIGGVSLVIVRRGIWMSARCIAKEEPPYVIVHAEPRLVEEMQDVVIDSRVMMG